MYCKQCGTEVDGNYCPECGNRLNDFPTEYNNVSFLGLASLILVITGFGGIYGEMIFLPIFVISGLYLYTRPEGFAKKRGKYLLTFLSALIILSVVVIVLARIMAIH